MRPAIGFRPVYREGEGPYMRSARMYRWNGEPPRPPRKGEHYLSGAEAAAYMASRDLSTPFFIAIPATGV